MHYQSLVKPYRKRTSPRVLNQICQENNGVWALISMSGTRCGKQPVPSTEPESISANRMWPNSKNVCSVKRVVIVSRRGIFRCLKPSRVGLVGVLMLNTGRPHRAVQSSLAEGGRVTLPSTLPLKTVHVCFSFLPTQGLPPNFHCQLPPTHDSTRSFNPPVLELFTHVFTAS